jgi:TatD DNase family protein
VTVSEQEQPLRWTDSHCHLPEGPDAELVVAEAAAAGVLRMVDVGTDVERSAQACERARRLPGVWATVGLHPHDASHGLDGLVELLDLPNVVAVGECGLDYHYDHSPRDAQKEIFAAQIQLAHERGLPLVIHTRSAWDDTFDILDAEGTPERTVFHCFTGGPDEARRGLDRGAVMSFSGIVTFPSAPEVREAAALCPADRYMVETDAPYLAPVPNRGRKNQPGWVPLVGAGVAEARGCSLAEVAEHSWNTAERFFELS